MLKLCRFIVPSPFSRRLCDAKDISWFNSLGSRHGYATTMGSFSDGISSDKIYAGYTVFKGKAALSFCPLLPTFHKSESGYSALRKNGCVLLTFWPATGVRKYDWEKRQVFALNPTEAGGLISLGANEGCEFLHDPSMKSSMEGNVKKSLSITPIEEKGYFVNLSVANNLERTNERLSVPVTKAEFQVIRTSLSYVLPHLIGLDQVVAAVRRHHHHQDAPQKSMKQFMEHPDPVREWAR